MAHRVTDSTPTNIWLPSAELLSSHREDNSPRGLAEWSLQTTWQTDLAPNTIQKMIEEIHSRKHLMNQHSHPTDLHRRRFLRQVGVSAAVLPFVSGLPRYAEAIGKSPNEKKQRVIIMFSPNGVVQNSFWPGTQGAEFETTPILEPLQDFKDRMLLVKGIANKVKGDGDSHMRGMSCLLTGTELNPGNIQGGSSSPAGWAGGISIDQELKNFCQSADQTRTRFGSIEFGVAVPDRADPWTRMSYAGSNRPVAPNSNPYSIFARMYGRSKDQDLLRSVLDDVNSQLKKVAASVGSTGKTMLAEHQEFVYQMENDLKQAAKQKLLVPAPGLEVGVRVNPSNMPKISRMQIDLMVNGFANDMNRVATLQYTNSVGQARMPWIGINEPHHQLSHDPDMKEDSQKKLVKINQWFAGEMHYLLKRLAETPDPGTDQSLLDNTLVIWTNELGKGNSHTLQNIPMLMVGGADGFKMGRYLKVENQPHNRLWLQLAHAFGHNIETFGKAELCKRGALQELAG